MIITNYRVDLHSHTNISWDGWMSPAALVRRARNLGLDRIAITDHDAIEGALRARDIDPDLVIVGEEVRCAEGTELIGLYLERRIPPGLPLLEVAARIRDQGGLVYAPHPFGYLRHISERAEQLLAHADVVEVFNGRAFWPAWNARAARVARDRGLRAAASSDAHLPSDCGRAWTEVPAFSNAAELLAGLASAVLVTHRTVTPLAHIATLTVGNLRRISGRLRSAPSTSLRVRNAER